MNRLFLKLYVILQDLKDREEGQDLVEYALVIALVSFGAIAGMKVLASGIQSSYNSISTTFKANV
jgi:pilus assembly protein Flp/PilA